MLAVDWPSNANRDYSRHEAEPGVPSNSVLLREFDLDVSPWSTGQSLRASDDVAQLLVSYGIAFQLKAVVLYQYSSVWSSIFFSLRQKLLNGNTLAFLPHGKNYDHLQCICIINSITRN